MESLLSLFKTNSNSSEELEQLKRKLKSKSVKKGTILQAKGDKKLMNYFVKKGLLKSYTIDDKAKEHIFMFAPEGWVAWDIESITKNAPATLYIEALEDSELEVIGESTMELLETLPSETVSDQAKRLLKRIAVLQHRVIMLMSASAAERYEEFVST